MLLLRPFDIREPNPGKARSFNPALWIAVLLLFAGCATEGGSSSFLGPVTVRVDLQKLLPERQDAPRLANVDISDIRQKVHSERTTIKDISMGSITIEPAEATLIRELVEAKADAALARSGKGAPASTVYVGIREFQIHTPVTLLYWDVTARIDLVLRVGSQDQAVSVRAVERTYAWPTQELIQRVTDQAMRRLAADTEKAVAELLGAR